MREIRTSGSVRGGEGNLPAYSATKVPTREVGGASTKPKVVRRKAKADRKEEVIKFMVTSEQKRVFAEAAAAAGLDLSGWFRWLATREISGK